MSTQDVETDAYELLGITTEASEASIRKAYRQRSLKVHPDRNPNNPNAAQKFHELNQAYELLLDPLRRLVLDNNLRVKHARKTRFTAFDAKRKDLQRELEEREREHKKQKLEKHKEEKEKREEAEKIKEQGRRMREEKEREVVRKQAQLDLDASPEEEFEEDMAPALGHLDTTIRLKYPLASHPNLTTTTSLADLLAQFGPTDHTSIVLSLKSSKKHPDKPPKFATALIPFKQIGDAFAAVGASGREERGLESIEITWAEGKEPEIVKWLRKQGQLGGGTRTEMKDASEVNSNNGLNEHVPAAQLPQQSKGSSSTPFSSFPESFTAPTFEPPKFSTAGLDYESLTLMRMRQAERERIGREIKEREALE